MYQSESPAEREARVRAEKALYMRYRERAIIAAQNTNVNVPVGASVLVCEDGAFVEATLWVPRE